MTKYLDRSHLDAEQIASRIVRCALEWASYMDANGLRDPQDRLARAAGNFARLRLLLECERYVAATHERNARIAAEVQAHAS